MIFIMNVLTLTTPDVENGYGNRVTLWVAGCTHKCPECHNKHTWAYNQGVPIDNPEVYDKIYDESNHDYIQGLTLSGGDPLDQSDESINKLIDFIIKYKYDFPEKDIWVYTGCVYEDLLKRDCVVQLLSLCDVLVDGTFDKRCFKLDLAFRGSTNQRIIDLNKTSGTNIVEIEVD